MSDDEKACCILGICCEPGSAAQFSSTLAMVKRARPAMSEAQATAAARRVLDAHGHFGRVSEVIDREKDARG